MGPAGGGGRLHPAVGLSLLRSPVPAPTWQQSGPRAAALCGQERTTGTKLLPAARRREATCGASLPRSPARALPGIGAPGHGRGLAPPSRRPLPKGRLCPAQDLDLVVREQMVSGAARGRSEAALSESPTATAGPRDPGARRPGPVLTATAAPSAGRLHRLGFQSTPQQPEPVFHFLSVKSKPSS